MIDWRGWRSDGAIMARFTELRQICPVIWRGLSRVRTRRKQELSSLISNVALLCFRRCLLCSENVPQYWAAGQRHEGLIHALLSIEEGRLSSRLFIQLADSCRAYGPSARVEYLWRSKPPRTGLSPWYPSPWTWRSFQDGSSLSEEIVGVLDPQRFSLMKE